MASKKRDNKHRALEVTGIILIGISVFLGCCLVTYHPDDPSFGTQPSEYPEKIHNWCNLTGAWLSDFLLQLLGLGAYIVPAALLLLALKMLFRPGFSLVFYIRLCFYFLLFLCAETLLSLGLGKLALPRYNFDAGGALVGRLLAGSLTGYLGVFGTYLLLVLVCLLAVMGLTQISYVKLWSRLFVSVQGRTQAPVRRLVVLVKLVVDQTAAGFRTLLSRRLFEKKKNITLATGKKNTPDDSIPSMTDVIMPGREPDDIPITVYREADSVKKTARDNQSFSPVRQEPAPDYMLPPLSLLDDPEEGDVNIDRDALRDDAEVLIQKLADFGVSGRVVEINPGPVITRFEFEPSPGIKLNRVVSLADDLALALKAMSVRIAPIPGKSVIGIEIPNKKRKKVAFKEVVSRERFQNAASKLTIGLGKDIAGGTIINDLARMPHLLIAGATGSGKSIFVNTVICSILFKASPDEVKFLMIDPKRLELFPYDGIPHLLHPVVVDPRKAAVALRWVVEEMDRRYQLLALKGTRDIEHYNKRIDEELQGTEPLPEKPTRMNYIVVVIDELADLMMIAARDVEGYIARLAQMARASGIHLLIATQRPSVDILTGVIKANFPCRISFQVSSKVDSRTIIDTMGAEKLLGRGDMLFMPPGTSRLQRIHGAHISEREIKRATEFIKKQARPSYDESIVAAAPEEHEPEDEEAYDELYDKAVAFVTETRQASISMLQRRMRVGYNRAARMIERMEKEGVVGPSDGIKPREVLVNKL